MKLPDLLYLPVFLFCLFILNCIYLRDQDNSQDPDYESSIEFQDLNRKLGSICSFKIFFFLSDSEISLAYWFLEKQSQRSATISTKS